MSLILFDCTQFINIKIKDNSENLIDTLKKYEELDFEMLMETEIQSKKMIYFKDYLEGYTIELKHDQFLGFFDDWIEKDKVPNQILRFANISSEIINNPFVEEIKIIFVEYASENKELDHLVQVECDINNLVEKLFYQSSACFDEWGNIMIITVRKSN